MKLDSLKSGNIDRSVAGQIQYQMVRGRIAELLLINDVTWHYRDKLTVKLRHEGGIKTLVDRVSILRLAELCDLKKGLPTTGSPDFPGEPEGTNNDRNGLVQVNQGIRVFVTALTLPLGHITLTGGQQLEITVETAAMDKQPDPANPGQFLQQPKGRVELLAVTYKARVDTLITYDVSSDLEAQQGGIREVYLCGVNNISLFHNSEIGQNSSVYGLPVPMDITVKIGSDEGDTEADLNAYSALTFISMEPTAPYGNLIRVFQDLESLPASIYLKVFGDDAKNCELLYIREDSIPHMVAGSIISAVDSEQRRIEHLEQNDPAKAKALQQTGQIATSEALAAAKDSFVPAVGTPSK